MLSRFFIIAFVLCWAITIPIALQTQGVITTQIIPPGLQWLIGFVPLAAALLAGGFGRRRQDVFRFAIAPGWYLAAALLPWIILAVSRLIRQIGGFEQPEMEISGALLAIGLFWLLLAFGEEAGWRGVALPALIKRFGYWRGSTILGVLWCVWHFPKLFCSPFLKFNAEGVGWIVLFSAQIIIANYLICLFYLRTRSVLATSVFHAGWNTVATAYFLAATDIVMTAVLAAVFIAAAILLGDSRADSFGGIDAPMPEIGENE